MEYLWLPFLVFNILIPMKGCYSIKVSPVVYMSPVLGLVRKGRKSSAWLLMCSAVRDRSSFTLMINPG